MADELNPNLDIAVDGGVDLNNAVEIVKNGANILIMGSSIFKAENPRKRIEVVRKILNESGFEVDSI